MVSKKGQLAIGAFVILFLGVMIGLALIPQIAENTNEMTNKFNVNNESNSYKICRTTDYIYEGTTGVVELKNTTSAICGAGNRTNGNNTFIYYSYCTAGYVTDSA